MKVRELIELLQKEDPETVVYLMNGVGGNDILTEDCVGWSYKPLFPIWDGPKKYKVQGPEERVLCIFTE